MGGAGSGDSAASAALEDGVTVSSVDDDVGNDDDGKRRRINFESGIASMPSPNWYSSTHLTVGLVRDFGASLPRNYHHHHHREEEEVSSSTSENERRRKGGTECNRVLREEQRGFARRRDERGFGADFYRAPETGAERFVRKELV
jgi:hypothetical protein